MITKNDLTYPPCARIRVCVTCASVNCTSHHRYVCTQMKHWTKIKRSTASRVLGRLWRIWYIRKIHKSLNKRQFNTVNK